ncbi:gamma-taxilin-like [Symsagittifera roscoffensis]|uniref:gamma-taxilin-like n=1 Tax=Symsagittifera roscoffensis TaxID=84072 RepID=UPI00307C7CD8
MAEANEVKHDEGITMESGNTESTDVQSSPSQQTDQISTPCNLTEPKPAMTENGAIENEVVDSSAEVKPSPKRSSKKHATDLQNGETPAFATSSASEKLDKGARRNIEAATKSMLKALSQLESPEEKIAALCSRYADLLSEHKQLQNYLKDTTKSQQQVQKEKDKLQSDHNKTLLAKERLENLCRELQKQNKIVKEESLKRSLEEQSKIREVSDRFQNTISEVQTSMSENCEKNDKLKEENEQLCVKIKSLIQQYEKREEYVEMLTKTKEMEKQLVEAKLKETTMILAEEREHNLIERQKLLSDNVEMRQRCETLVAQLEASKTKDKMYADKFDEFETTLSKSNEMFTTFKSEMDKTSKRIKTLEKETQMWKAKFDGANKSLVQLMEERIGKERELVSSGEKTKKLEKLCRALQEERNGLSEKNRRMERQNKHLRIQCGELVDTDDTETNQLIPEDKQPNGTTEANNQETAENNEQSQQPDLTSTSEAAEPVSAS